MPFNSNNLKRQNNTTLTGPICRGFIDWYWLRLATRPGWRSANLWTFGFFFYMESFLNLVYYLE